MKLIESEDDVRRWLSRAAKARGAGLFWVENKSGGTSGFPDATWIEVGDVAFLELKVGSWKNGRLEFEARNAQRIVMRQMIKAGGRALVVVGEIGTRRVWIGPGMGLTKLRTKDGGSGSKVKMAGPHFLAGVELAGGGSDLGSEFIGKFFTNHGL